MNNKLKEFKKILTFSETKSQIEEENSFTKESDMAFYDFDKIQEEALKNNEILAAKNTDPQVKEVCFETEKLIETAAADQESLLIEIFNRVISRADEKWSNFKNERKFKSLYKNFCNFKSKLSSKEFDKYSALKEKGQPEELNNYYDHIYKNITKDLDAYKALDLKSLELHKANNLEYKLSDVLKPLILNKIDRGQISEALDFWDDYPQKVGYKYIALEIAEKIGQKIISQSSQEFSKDKEGRKSSRKLVQDQLQDHPEIYFLYLLSQNKENNYERRDLAKDKIYFSALENINDDPKKSYVFNFVDLENNLLKRDLTPGLRVKLFKEYQDNSAYEIKSSLDIFQNEVDFLSVVDRKNLFEQLSITSSHDIIAAGKFLKFSKDEIKLILSSKYLSEDKNEVQASAIQEVIDRAKSSSPLTLLTNAETFDITQFEQEELLKILAQEGRLSDFKQLLDHPEKYPNLSVKMVQENFAEFLKQHNNADTLSGLIYNKVLVDPEQKKVLIETAFSNDPMDYIDFLSKNDQYLELEDRLLIENKFIESFSKDGNFYRNYNFSILTPESLSVVMQSVQNINSDQFFKLFIDNANTSLIDKYFDLILSKLNNPSQLLLMLDSKNRAGEVSVDRQREIVSKIYKICEIESLLIDSIDYNSELSKDLGQRVIAEASITGLLDALNLVKNDKLKMTEDEKNQLCRRIASLADFSQLSYLANQDSGIFAKWANGSDKENLINICIQEKNSIVLSDILNYVQGINGETVKKLIDAIIDFGDSAARISLLNYINFQDRMVPKSDFATIDKKEALISVMIDHGSNQELFNVLKDCNFQQNNLISDEQISLAKNKLLANPDQAVFSKLFYLYIYNQKEINLNASEKSYIGKFLLDNVTTNADILEDLIKKNKEFGFNENQVWAGLNNLSHNVLYGRQFLRLLKDNSTYSYFTLDETKQKILLNNVIDENATINSTLFSYYVDYNLEQNNNSADNPFRLDDEQLSRLIIHAVNFSYNNPEYILSSYVTLNKFRESLSAEKKADILVLSPAQEESLVYSYVKNNHYDDINSLNIILDNYPNYLDQALLKTVSNNNFSSFFKFIEAAPEVANRVDSVIKEQVLEYFKNISENSNQVEQRWGVYKFYSLFNELNLLTVDDLAKIEQQMDLEKNNRNKILNFTLIFNSLLTTGVNENVDQIAGKEVFEKFKAFEKKYNNNKKGKNILTLVAATEYDRAAEIGLDMSFKNIFLNIAKKLDEYDYILSAHKSEDIPEGLRVSIGMEYEVTQTISKSYSKNTQTSYKQDVLLLSALGELGQGCDAVHEFATKPTDNPYVMLLEMKLLQDLGFIDFNFKDKDLGGYNGSATGFHLTVGGENDLNVDHQINFLQNAVLVGNLGGVYSGTEVSAVGKGRGSIRQRGNNPSNNILQVFDNLKNSVELRSFSIDKWEQFERNILINYHGAIAIQAVEKYTKIMDFSDLEPLLDKMPQEASSLYEFLQKNDLIKEEVADERVKEIIYEWILVQVEMSRSVSDHNDNFLDNETSGYLDDQGIWVDVKEFSKGRDNQQSFAEIIKTVAPGKNLDEYFQENLKFKNAAEFFNEISVDMANKLTRINNLYLKGDKVNIQNMLSTVVDLGNTNLNLQASESSVFDNRGQIRKGRYYIQGSSDRLIVNRVQDLLLRFNDRMQNIMQNESRNVENLLAA